MTDTNEELNWADHEAALRADIERHLLIPVVPGPTLAEVDLAYGRTVLAAFATERQAEWADLCGEVIKHLRRQQEAL